MIEHHEFDLSAVRLHAVTDGPEDGPLVLLLHGFPEFWRGWRHQIAPLAAAGFRVLVPDQRGYNLSDKPRRVRDYALELLVEDAVRLIEAAGHTEACVAGHDWGGLVAWWTAVRFPQRVRRLAVLNIPHPHVLRRHILTNPLQRRRSHYVFKMQLPWLPERRIRRHDWRVAERNTRGTARPGAFDDAEMEAYRAAWERPGAIRSMVHWYRAALRYPPSREIDPRVRVPTRILWGVGDPYLGREMVEPSLGLCDDGGVEWFERATHWLQHEEPDRVSGCLIDFFGEGRSRPGR